MPERVMAPPLRVAAYCAAACSRVGTASSSNLAISVPRAAWAEVLQILETAVSPASPAVPAGSWSGSDVQAANSRDAKIRNFLVFCIYLSC